MEYQLYAAELFALLLFLYCLFRWKNGISLKLPPQPSGAWPIIGHLLLLGDLPHKSLGTLADTYGPIFMIKLGLKKGLVVSSPEMARECLGNNDRVFLNRPQTVFVEHLGFNSAMLGFSPHGPYWREMRKIVTLELLSNHRLKEVKMSEIRSAMKALFDNCRASDSGSCSSKPVDMKWWFNDISLNNIVRLIAGQSLKEFYHGEKYNLILKAFRDFFELAAVFVPADVLPFMRWLDIGGYEKAMRNAAKDIDNMAQEWLEDHKRRRVHGDAQKTRDFMDVLLGIFETPHENVSKFEKDVIIKATSMIQAELDSFVGKERQVVETDLKNLVYLQEVLKETMRLYPAGPLSVPRESISDSTVGGYHVPEGTQLFVNLYKIHRDPDSWKDPCEFRPERFLTTHKDYDVRGQHFDYMPFGSGRRICPGISFAIQFMQFTLASLLHGFGISTPMNKSVDMTEGFGLTNLKVTPLDVILIPRLPDCLYEHNTDQP